MRDVSSGQVPLDVVSATRHNIAYTGETATLRKLTLEAMLAVSGYALATGLIFLLLIRDWQPANARRWAAQAVLVLAYLAWTLYRNLGKNHPPEDERLYGSIGLANHLSLLRGVLLAWLAGFIFSPRPESWLAWMPGVLYTAAILIDYADGIVARLTAHASVLGQSLDAELDALGILIAPALGIWWGQLPIWYALVALAYYAYVLGKWLRKRQGKPLRPLPASGIRRPMAGIQMGFISAILWPLFDPPLTTAAATLVMAPFVAGFARDWLVVSGVVDAGADSYQSWMKRTSIIAQRWLPVLLRLAIALTFVTTIARTGRFALHEALSPLNAVWMLALAGLVLVGWLGRLAGTLLAIFVGIALVRWGPTPASAIVFGCGLGLMLLGTGALSLWQPEEEFLLSHYGGRE